MKKLVLIGLGLLMYSNVYADGVYLSRSTLEAATTNYILIDRNEGIYNVSGTTTSDTSDYFAHSSNDKYNMEINEYEIVMSSAVTDVKLGQIYDINASTAMVRWFGIYSRKGGDDTLVINRDKRLYLDRDNKNIKIESSNESINTSDSFFIYDSTVKASPAKGDIIANVSADSTVGDLSIYIDYKAK